MPALLARQATRLEAWLAWVAAAVQVARTAWGFRQASRLAYVAPRPDPEGSTACPRVSVVVPARNEAANIRACLEAILAQRHPGLEIVVVDDRSEDATAAIAGEVSSRDGRVRLVAGEPLPSGWIGKCWALHQGAQHATGEWLLFVDADTRLRPGAVAGALDEARRRGAAVFSALTEQELPTVWERVVMPAVFAAIAEAMPIELVNNPGLPGFALANGQFLLVRRDAYDAIGGHAAIRAEIAEDARFAQRAKQLGWRYWLGDGRALATAHMYDTPAAMWDGWTKNLHAGVRLNPWIVPPGLVVFAAGLIGPYWTLYRAAQTGWGGLALTGLVQLGALFAARRRVDATFGVPWRYTLAQPFGHAAFIALLSASLVKVLSGRGVTWKGRRYYASDAGDRR